MRRRRTPSPAMVVACLALAGTWGGPAVADVLITGADVRNESLTHRDVKNRSLSGRDLKSNTITGRNVKGLSGRDIGQDTLDGWHIFEENLGEVPRARQAQSAVTAANADHAAVADRLATPSGAATPLRVAATLGAGSEQHVLDAGGLRVRARCQGTGQLEAQATTTVSGALVRTTVIKSGQAATYAEDDDFRTGDAFNLLPSGRGNVGGSLLYMAPGGAVVTLTYSADEGVTGLTPGGGCLLFGHGLSSSG